MEMISEIVRDISDRLELNLSLNFFQSVHGGDINAAFQLRCQTGSGQTQRYFVKINSASRIDMFEQEAKSLSEIAATNSILVPQAVCSGLVASNSYLALEYFSISSNGKMENLARALARMHLNTSQSFGFSSHNYIGTTPQPNVQTKNWIEFFTNQRILHQIQLLESKGTITKLKKKVLSLCGRLPEFFEGYKPKASLVHGDLWSGNYSFLSNGTPIIYDPACYYGDHEVDLAMLELFGRPGASFFAAYREIFPIDPGYPKRKILYNLYHIFNHANLFGGGYFSQAERMLEDLLAN